MGDRIDDAGAPDLAAAARAGALLTVDLGAIRANYRLLRARAGGAEVAGVLKADAYGLGMAQVAPALVREGCRTFFTAHLDEALRLRPLVPAASAIYVLHGPMPGTAPDFLAHGLVPVLNDAGQAREWRTLAATLGRRLPAAIQVDSGMSRMGMSGADLAALGEPAEWLQAFEPRLLMSHLACADLPDHPLNALQHARFEALRARFPAMPASLANSSAVFLGPSWHYELVRPGAALYGINPQPGAMNPLRQAVSLQARIVQVRTVQAGDAVGYGARWVADGTRRIATLSIGYADGWLRALTNRGFAFIEGMRVPVAGTVSMDSITLDVTGVPEALLMAGRPVELLGPHQQVDAVAQQAGTIGYEVLTRLGGRFYRRYLDN
ncbi:alanine racemase [Massilia forsythiae]|uniref:Alanine racemase n=1 Tax=Massilia forsythiae TaxID=2728020 RepID=A0A7Z2ZTW1_9BURK|nr:alanine racemase [Massilia forsythiae]QJE02006.1 alanine racemase [Massilia forsythiae]